MHKDANSVQFVHKSDYRNNLHGHLKPHDNRRLGLAGVFLRFLATFPFICNADAFVFLLKRDYRCYQTQTS